MRIGSPEPRLLFPNTDLFSVSDSGELAIMPGGWTRWPNLLARVPLSGGAPREVVENVAWANADWAPGGKELAVVRSVGGRNRLEFPIGRVIYQTEAQIRAPRFSPDGRRIAFYQGYDSVLVIDSDGRNRKVLSSGWSGTWGVPCWARGGEEILFTASRGTGSGLWAVNSRGKERRLAQVPGDLELFDALPDGRVLVGHQTTTSVLMGLPPGESEERDLSWLDASWNVDLSPDGGNILFSEIGEGGGPESGVYLRPTSGAPAKRLGEGTAMALSPDGRWAIASRGGRAWLLPTGPGESKSLTETNFERLGGADWCPDGKCIVFSAREQGRGERLYLQAVSGGSPRAISPEGVGLLTFGGSVSPDGRLVVGLPVLEQPGIQHPEQRGAARLYPLEGGTPRPIPGLREQELPVQWNSDGKSLFVYKRTESPAKVWLVDTATGRRRPWRELGHPDRTFTKVQRLLLTPDGNSYAYVSRRTQSALYLIEACICKRSQVASLDR
jgi:Tol biopolymer transport system component